ncbi:PTS fructose transporter subunit IIC [Aerococcus sp. Group 1]|uniref:PTS fructose transporter subunit IIC n=1 Tax=Aerococcus urinae (strain CCUG 59500 / ACS-120-V-Col10a) TaxID=2976812 RepID=UPI00227CBFAA|nr:PTS fructose transporter subunit IIC [Aerococcus sp. Group 1]MCY3031488.1 PTS fructose transporter subunit IIC [Aerococcus sp. Group 1]
MKDNKIWKDLKKAFNTGVSYMLPAVVVGGIFLAVALSTGTATDAGLEITNPFMRNLNELGNAGFAMMIPLLAGYIAHSLAGKPGLVPGMILGYVANNPIGANQVKTGFLGAMILGVLAGYFVRWAKTWKVPQMLKTIMPILIVPIATVFVIGMLYVYLIATPIGAFMDALVRLLSDMQGGSSLHLGVLIGAMTAVDMGGPINKTATAFTIALMAEGVYAPNGAHRIACAIPPLALAISTFIDGKKYDESDRNLGLSTFFMGLIGITEGAIPFAVKDMKSVLPAIIIGSAVGGAIGMMNGVECLVPHGGLIVLPVVNGKLWYTLAIFIGAIVAAIILHFTKKNINQENI